MSTYQARIADLVQRDPRYAYEAYEFVFAALSFTQERLGRTPDEHAAETPGPENHVSGRELLEGIRQLAVREFGLMARVVFRLWGVRRTDDFGEIVFNLVQEKLMSTTEQDTREDFHEVYNLDQDLIRDFRIELDEAEWLR